MKVLFSVDSMNPKYGGVASSIATLYKGFLNPSYNIEIDIGVGDNFEGNINFDGFNLYVHYLRNIASRDFDVVHHNGLWSIFGKKTLDFFHSKKVVTVLSTHGMLEPWSLKQKHIKKSLALFLYQRKILQDVTILHATSLQECANIRSLGIKNDIAVIPNATDLRTKMFIRKNRPRKLLFLSRIHKKKGLEILLEVLSSIESNFELNIVGDGECSYLNRIKKIVFEKNLENQVNFLGYLEGDEKNKAYLNADFFILPTYSENFGNVIVEAMKYSLPVVTTSGTPWRSLTNRNCGYIIEPNSGDLKKALLKIQNLSLDEYVIMQKNAYTYSSEFDVENICDMYKELYNYSILKDQKPDFIY